MKSINTFGKVHCRKYTKQKLIVEDNLLVRELVLDVCGRDAKKLCCYLPHS